MQKVIIDTNVIVSALIQKSYPFLIVYELVIEDKISICLSNALLTEYHEVLERPKFHRFPDFVRNAQLLLDQIITQSLLYMPTININLISDPDDNFILELAHESNADFIITGNTNDFTFPSYKETKIVTPKEYWENYKP